MTTAPTTTLAEVQALAARCAEAGDPDITKGFEQRFGVTPEAFVALDEQAQQERVASLSQPKEAHANVLKHSEHAVQVQLLGRIQTVLAERAFEAYNFGEGVSVVGASGWEYYEAGHERSREVYVETDIDDGKEKSSTRLGFTVRFDSQTGVLAEAYALDQKGQEWGQMPSDFAAKVAQKMKVYETGCDSTAWNSQVLSIGQEFEVRVFDADGDRRAEHEKTFTNQADAVALADKVVLPFQGNDVLAIRQDRIFADAQGEVGAAWAAFVDAENKLANLLLQKAIKEAQLSKTGGQWASQIVLVDEAEAEAYTLSEREGAYDLMRSEIVDGKLENSSTRFDFDLDWVDLGADEINHVVSKLEKLAENFESKKIATIDDFQTPQKANAVDDSPCPSM